MTRSSALASALVECMTENGVSLESFDHFSTDVDDSCFSVCFCNSGSQVS